MDISFTVCVFVFSFFFRLFVYLFVCTVTYFSTEDKASGVKFCMGFFGIQDRECPIFEGTLLPQKPKIGRIGQQKGD